MNATTTALRIWIAVDALDRSADVLGAAMRLAAGRAVELAGLFVEDADLLRLAGWPSATETRLFEASLRQVGGAELEAALRAQALALQRRVDALARDIGVPWSFRTARGRVVQQALHLAGSGDWIVLASAATGLRLRQAAPRARGRWSGCCPTTRRACRGCLRRRRATTRRAAPSAAPSAAWCCRPMRRAPRSCAPCRRPRRGRCGSLRGRTDRARSLRPAVPGDLVLMTRDSGAADPQRLGRLLRRGVGPLALV